jgi:translation initiation factor 4E transporter
MMAQQQQQQQQQQPQNSIGNVGPQMMPSAGSMNFDFQQQQQIQKMNQMQKAQFIQQQQQQQMMQMKKQQMDSNPVLSQFMAQQQQRAQSQFRSQFQQQQQQQQPMGFPSSMMQGRDKPADDNCELHTFQPRSSAIPVESRNMMNNGGCLSPTSNQLAKWFSPELLADASAGKLLPSLNVGQMMSLEELEKCMQNS